MALSFSARLNSLSLETFKSGFDLDEFIGKLYKEVLNESELEDAASARANPAGTDPKGALMKVRKLLEHFKRYRIWHIVSAFLLNGCF